MRQSFGLAGKRSPAQIEYIVENRLREIERGNWDQQVEDYRLGRRSLPPIGGASPVKDRFGVSAALGGTQSGWEVPDLVEFEYSYLNFAGATTYNGTIFGIVPGSNAAAVYSPDPLPPALTAANGNRVIGSGSTMYAALLSAWIFSRTSAGGVYTAAAGTTLQPIIISAGQNANQATTNVSVTQSIPGLTQFWTQITFSAAPTERQFSLQGGTAASVFQLFTGDVIVGQLVTTGALNVQGNQLCIFLELA